MYQYNDSSTLADHILSLIEDPSLTETISTESIKFSESYQRVSKKQENIDIYSINQ